MILALASTDWLMAEGWRQGLFVHCIEEDVVPPLPFNLQDPPGCYSSRDVFYIKATAALCILTLVADAVATLLTGSGLRTQDHNMKYKFYRIAVIIMSIARKLTGLKLLLLDLVGTYLHSIFSCSYINSDCADFIPSVFRE